MKNTSTLIRNILAAVLLTAGFTTSAAKLSSFVSNVETHTGESSLSQAIPCEVPPKFLDVNGSVEETA